jgi:anaerobic ribonucleoside-triphosphate reductase activating protein
MKKPSRCFLSRPDAVNVAHMVDRCRVLGPGERFVLWVQGCPLRCPDCHNPDFLPFRDATWMSIDQIADRILKVSDIEGTTFLGGEPLAQAGALASLSQRVRRTGLSIMVYSGYTFAELTSGHVPDAKLLLDTADLLMDGPYMKDLPTQRPWRGSDNQRLIALSARYADRVEVWNQPLGQDFEMRISAEGTIEILGIPPPDLSRDFSKVVVPRK